MANSDNDHKVAKLQTIQAISVALIGALATIVGAYIATSSGSKEKNNTQDSLKKIEISVNANKAKLEANKREETLKNTPQNPNKAVVEPNKLPISPTSDEFKTAVNQQISKAETLLKQILVSKVELKKKISQTEVDKRFKMKDQLIRLEEIEEKIGVDLGDLKTLMEVKTVKFKEKNGLQTIKNSLIELETELAEF